MSHYTAETITALEGSQKVSPKSQRLTGHARSIVNCPHCGHSTEAVRVSRASILSAWRQRGQGITFFPSPFLSKKKKLRKMKQNCTFRHNSIVKKNESVSRFVIYIIVMVPTETAGGILTLSGRVTLKNRKYFLCNMINSRVQLIC